MRALACLAILVIPFVANAQDCVEYEDYYPDSGPIIGQLATQNKGSVAYSEGYAFVGNGGEVLVVDVSDPASPSIVSLVAVSGEARQIILENDILYVACDYSGLDIINVSNPLVPYIIHQEPTPGRPHDVALEDGVIFLAVAQAGVCTIDVADPSSPIYLDNLDLPGEEFGVAVRNSIAYLVSSGGGIYVVDASNPAELVSSEYIHAGDNILLHGIRIQGNYAYVANYGVYGSSTTGSLQIYNLQDPLSPELEGEVFTGGSAWAVSIQDRYAYVSDQQLGLFIVDTDDRESPTIIGWADVGASIYTCGFSEDYFYTNSGPSSGYTFQVIPRQCGPVFSVMPDGSGYYVTIQAALDSVPNESEVLLGNGEFTGPGNTDLDFHGKSVFLASLSRSPDSCVIDCQGTESEHHRGFHFQSSESSDAVIEGITIQGGYTDEGGAIKCEGGSSPTIRNCILRDNYATSGGALSCSEASEPYVEFTLMYFNEATTGGAIFAMNSLPSFSNCTISYNTSPAAGGAFMLYSAPMFENCIFSHNLVGPAVSGYESSPMLTCTDVVWNEGGDWVGCIADQQNQNGNFSNTPAFCDPESGDFRLQPGSPCLPDHNSCEVLVGALGEGDCAPTGVEEVPIDAGVALSAYPNPFNPHLTITFSLPADAKGSVVVHDVSGRHVRVLKDGQFTQIENEISWNGENDHGRDVASGVYFVRLITEEYQESKKVVLLR